jgi:hypothetical protein
MGDFVFKSGVIESKRDPRDFLVRNLFGALPLPQEKFFDRIPVMGQGDWGTCVGHGGAALKVYQERDNYHRIYDFSRLFLYKKCKEIDGYPDQEGTQIQIAMKMLLQYGICFEKSFPYELMNADIHAKPSIPAKAEEEAKQFKIGAYARAQTIEEIKIAMQKSPLVGGVWVFDNFLQPEGNGMIDIPQGFFKGCHCILFDGFDDNMTYRFKSGKTRKGFFRFLNSWTESWGDKGYGYIPYDFFNYRSLDMPGTAFMEAWTSTDVVLPPADANKVELWIGSKTALIDGVEVNLDQEPTIDPDSNRTLVPLRFIFEILKWNVLWDGAQKKITLERNTSSAKMVYQLEENVEVRI